MDIVGSGTRGGPQLPRAHHLLRRPSAISCVYTGYTKPTVCLRSNPNDKLTGTPPSYHKLHSYMVQGRYRCQSNEHMLPGICFAYIPEVQIGLTRRKESLIVMWGKLSWNLGISGRPNRTLSLLFHALSLSSSPSLPFGKNLIFMPLIAVREVLFYNDHTSELRVRPFICNT